METKYCVKSPSGITVKSWPFMGKDSGKPLTLDMAKKIKAMVGNKSLKIVPI